MYQQPSNIEGKLHLKVAIISALIATVILGLVVAIIVIATNKPVEESEVENTTNVVDNGAEEANKAAAATSEEVTGEVNTTNESSTYTFNKKSDTASTSAVKDLPKTGPEELLPMALIGGALVAYGASELKTRRK